MARTPRFPALKHQQAECMFLDIVKDYLKQSFERRAPDAYLTHAWEEFYRIYSEVLRRMAARFRFAAHEIEDVVQEVWSQVCTHLPQMEWHSDSSGLRAWLHTLVRNRALDTLRRKIRRPMPLPVNWQECEPIDPVSLTDREQQNPWDDELLRLLVAEMRDEVTPDNYQLLTLRLIDGRSLSEIGQAMKLSPGQIKFRQNRMFRKLRVKLALYRGVPFQQFCDTRRRSKKLS